MDHIAWRADANISPASDQSHAARDRAHRDLVGGLLDSDLLVWLEERIFSVLNELAMGLVGQTEIALAGLDRQELALLDDLEVLGSTLLAFVRNDLG